MISCNRRLLESLTTICHNQIWYDIDLIVSDRRKGIVMVVCKRSMKE